MNDTVKDWQLYEAGKKYNREIKCINGAGYNELVDALIDFVNGNQWRNLEISGMRKPVFNILSKALRYWVASIAATNTKIDIEPLEYAETPNDGNMDVVQFASAEISNLLEKFKIDNRIRDALQKAGTIGDVGAHLYFDPTQKPYGGAFGDVKGVICFELVNGTNVFFGNANNPSTDRKVQPYIIISGRDTVTNLKAEAKRYRDAQKDEDGIQEDKDYAYEAGEAAEIEVDADGYGKATYIIVYRAVTKKEKKQRPLNDSFGNSVLDDLQQPVMENYEDEKETITASKCVPNAYIYENVDIDMVNYPLAWLTWDKQESQYHGRPPLAEAMETQIFINLMFAMVMYQLAMSAFPKAIYDGDRIDGWDNSLGQAIEVKDLQAGEDIKKFAAYLETGQISPQIFQVLEMAYKYLKDMLGINDAAVGDVNPEEASGTAILATVKQSSIPLENTRANMYEWIEDIGRILLDMMGTYYGLRPIVINEDGKKVVKQFDFSVLKDIWLNVKVDVGTTNVWNNMARKQTLTNLLNEGKIELIDWLEAIDDEDLPNRQKLIDKIRVSMQQQQNEAQLQAFDAFISTLSPQLQAAIKAESQNMVGGGQGGTMPNMQRAPVGGANISNIQER
jgi:hypothetical protein